MNWDKSEGYGCAGLFILPYCGAPLGEALRHGALRPFCAACNFVQFYDPKVAVVALVGRDGAVLLIRRGVEPGKGLWALPGGFMDAGEMPATALQRELLDEVGLTVAVGRLLGIFPLVTGNAARGIVLACKATVNDDAAGVPVAADDVTDARWFSANALPTERAFDSTQALLAEWASNAGAEES